MTYQVWLLLAIGLSQGREDVLVVSALNYLWPVLSLLLSIPILGYRATPWIVPGSLIAIAGEVMVVAGGQETAFGGWNGQRLWTYALAAGAAVCWALYSNLTRRWAAAGHDNPVPVFLLLSGLVLALLVPFFGAGSAWNMKTIVEVVFLALVPQLLAYSLWDWAMGRGRAKAVIVASYFVPVVSAVLSCIYLGIATGWPIWTGTALLVVGAVLSYRALVEVKGKQPS